MAEYIIDVPYNIERIDANEVDAEPTLVGFSVREEVIRCRDCKHYRDYKTPFCMHFSIAYESSKTKGIALGCCYVNPDGFCAWAERSE